MMALQESTVSVEAITVVSGNVPVQQGVQNALYTVEQCDAGAPVYAGCERPLLRELDTAQFVHGEDGMGDLGLPLSGRQAAEGHGVDVLIETAARHAGALTLVTLGPLTNVALALRRAPQLAKQVSRCVMMAGLGYGHGNIAPAAEFNIWADPEAAHIVFGSGMPLTMVGWDISRTTAVVDAELKKSLLALGTERARFAVDIQRSVEAFVQHQTKLAGFDLPDPIAMAVALEPELATTEKRYIAISLGEGLLRGQTIVDHLRVTNMEPNVNLVTAVSREGFVAALKRALR